jgi:hypothetical protein
LFSFFFLSLFMLLCMEQTRLKVDFSSFVLHTIFYFLTLQVAGPYTV